MNGMHFKFNGKRTKIGYDTKEEAEAAIAQLPEDFEGDNERMNAYRCWCKKWHVGHRPLPLNNRYPAGDERLVGQFIELLRNIYG